ncbi:unnamed protein product [Ophioblennius macclurei]
MQQHTLLIDPSVT